MRKPRALRQRMLSHSAPVEVRVWLVRVLLHFHHHLHRRQHLQVCLRLHRPLAA